MIFIGSDLDKGMRIVFVNHGDFGNNSHHHIRALAKGLLGRGHQVVVVVAGDMRAAGLPDGVAVHCEQIEKSPSLQWALADPHAIIHVWTPRERVRHLAQRLGAGRLRYVVHLEDQEETVTASHSDTSWSLLSSLPDRALDQRIPVHLSYPRRYQAFLSAASGVTLITASLCDLCPPNSVTHILEPGVDLDQFSGFERHVEARQLAEGLGLAPGVVTLMHNGSIHPATRMTWRLSLRRSGC